MSTPKTRRKGFKDSPFDDYILTRTVSSAIGQLPISVDNMQKILSEGPSADSEDHTNAKYSVVIDLGFTFRFNQKNYSELYIDRNGACALLDSAWYQTYRTGYITSPSSLTTELWTTSSAAGVPNASICTSSVYYPSGRSPSTNSRPDDVLLAPWHDYFLINLQIGTANSYSLVSQSTHNYFRQGLLDMSTTSGFLDSVDARHSGVFIKQNHTTESGELCTIIRWHVSTRSGVGSAAGKGKVSFDVVLYKNGKIEFRYPPGSSAISTERDSATCGVFLTGRDNTFRDFSVDISTYSSGSSADRTKYKYGGTTYNSSWFDIGAITYIGSTAVADIQVTSSYASNLKLENWPAGKDKGCIFTFLPQFSNKRKILPRNEVRFFDTKENYPEYERPGNFSKSNIDRLFDDRKSINFFSGVVLNYPSRLSRFSGDGTINAALKQDLYSGDFDVTGSISADSLSFLEDENKKYVKPYTDSLVEDNVFQTGSFLEDFGIGFDRSVKSKTKIELSFPIDNPLQMIPISSTSDQIGNSVTSSIWYYDTKYRTFIAPGAYPDKNLDRHAHYSRNWLNSMDYRGFNPIGYPISSGAIEIESNLSIQENFNSYTSLVTDPSSFVDGTTYNWTHSSYGSGDEGIIVFDDGSGSDYNFVYMYAPYYGDGVELVLSYTSSYNSKVSFDYYADIYYITTSSLNVFDFRIGNTIQFSTASNVDIAAWVPYTSSILPPGSYDLKWRVRNLETTPPVTGIDSGVDNVTITEYASGSVYVGKQLTKSRFSEAIASSQDSVFNNQNYECTNAIVLPIKQPMLLEHATIELPLAAGLGWLLDKTETVSDYNHWAKYLNNAHPTFRDDVSFGGPAITLSLMKQNEYISCSNGGMGGDAPPTTSNRITTRDVILTSVITPDEDSRSEVYWDSDPNASSLTSVRRRGLSTWRDDFNVVNMPKSEYIHEDFETTSVGSIPNVWTSSLGGTAPATWYVSTTSSYEGIKSIYADYDGTVTDKRLELDFTSSNPCRVSFSWLVKSYISDPEYLQFTSSLISAGAHNLKWDFSTQTSYGFLEFLIDNVLEKEIVAVAPAVTKFSASIDNFTISELYPYTGSVKFSGTPQVYNGASVALTSSMTYAGLIEFIKKKYISLEDQSTRNYIHTLSPLGRDKSGLDGISGRSILGKEFFTYETSRDESWNSGSILGAKLKNNFVSSITNPFYDADGELEKYFSTEATLESNISVNTIVNLVTPKVSPYLLMPGDKLVLALSKTRPARHVYGASTLATEYENIHDSQILSGSLKINLYGTLLQDGIPHDPGHKQRIVSNQIHEVIGECITDQNELNSNNSYAGSIYDQSMRGVMFTPLKDGKNIKLISDFSDSSLYSGKLETDYVTSSIRRRDFSNANSRSRKTYRGLLGSALGNDVGLGGLSQISGYDIDKNAVVNEDASEWSKELWEISNSNTLKGVKLSTEFERDYDSLVPKIDSIMKVDGAKIIELKEKDWQGQVYTPYPFRQFGPGRNSPSPLKDTNTAILLFDINNHFGNLTTLSGTLTGSNGKSLANNDWTKAFPFENRYSEVLRTEKPFRALKTDADASYITSQAPDPYYVLLSGAIETNVKKEVDNIIVAFNSVTNYNVSSSTALLNNNISFAGIMPNELTSSLYIASNFSYLPGYIWRTYGGFYGNYSTAGGTDWDHPPAKLPSSDDNLKLLYGFGDLYTFCKPDKYGNKKNNGAGTKNMANFRLLINNAFNILIEPSLTVINAVSPVIRGWKYGLSSGLPKYSSAVYRQGRYGQFRDMLEPRQYTKSYENNTILPGIVSVKFLDSTGSITDSYNTLSSNLSFEATSSLPFFDGESRNR